MPKAKTKTETTLGDQTLSLAIRKLHASREARKAAEKVEEDLKTIMIKLLVPYELKYKTDIYIVMDKFPERGEDSNGAKVTVVHNIGRAVVSAEKLLEQGVDPEVIGKATTRTPYTQYTTGEAG